jgi:hypothetical protein
LNLLDTGIAAEQNHRPTKKKDERASIGELASLREEVKDMFWEVSEEAKGTNGTDKSQVILIVVLTDTRRRPSISCSLNPFSRRKPRLAFIS